MKRELPDIDLAIESGDLKPLLSWLRKSIHEPGATFLPGELVLRVTGSVLDPSHFVKYLNEKYSRIYGF
jgi:carboxypeptidase Taq